jgi:phage repressor protein C with HTH and peptisase S24 domain/transcriptional regulator with XRE-family HTH domain
MEPLGTKLRRQRRRLGFTLDELAGKTGISKPYLSLIETGRVPNPPSDEKLRRLEQALEFKPGELVSQAHLQRTPRDVRAMLQALMDRGPAPGVRGQEKRSTNGHAHGVNGAGSALGTSLDDAYLSGMLQELVDRSAGNVEQVRTGSVPVVNRVSAGYPKDFTDLSYPKGVADEYVGCPPDVHDRDAFAARVSGDSMTPKYRESDIVIFSPAAAPRDGDDCFVRFGDGQTTFKRVFFETGDEGKPVVRLQPRNEKYRPQVVPSDAISGLSRAIYRYQRVDQD